MRNNLALKSYSKLWRGVGWGEGRELRKSFISGYDVNRCALNVRDVLSTIEGY